MPKQKMTAPISVNQELERIQYLPNIELKFDKTGSLKDIDFVFSYFNKKDFIGRPFDAFGNPNVFKQVLDDKKKQRVFLRLHSINPDFFYKGVGMLRPIIKNNDIEEIFLSFIITDEIDHSNPIKQYEFTLEDREKMMRNKRQSVNIVKDTQSLDNIYFPTIGYWEWNIQYDRILRSDELWQMFDLDKEVFEPTYAAYLDQIHPDDQNILIKQVQQILKDKKPYKHQVRIHPQSEFSRIIEGHGKVVLNVEGEVIKLQGTARDITKYKHLESKLEKKILQLELFKNNATGMVYQFVLYPDGRIEFPFVSEGCQDIYNITSTHIMNDAMSIYTLFHPEDQNEFEQSVKQSAEALIQWNYEGRIIVDDQIKWVKGRSNPQKRGDGAIVWDGVLMDITKEKQLITEHENLMAITLQAQEKQKIAELNDRVKSEFIANMSHELRTPLNTIMGFSQVLQHGFIGTLNSKQLAYVTEILSSSDLLLNLINNILTSALVLSLMKQN